MDKMFIANRITELRLKKNVSEYQMSLDLGRNKSYIQWKIFWRSVNTLRLPRRNSLIRILQIHRFIQKHLILSNS